jgi:hypothetical protein
MDARSVAAEVAKAEAGSVSVVISPIPSGALALLVLRSVVIHLSISSCLTKPVAGSMVELENPEPALGKELLLLVLAAPKLTL